MSEPTLSPVLPGSSRPTVVHVTFPKMDIFVRFEVWNVTTKVFQPVPNMPVDLMDYNKVKSNTVVDTRTTDAKGFINFGMTETDLQDKSGEDTPDLFFKAHPKGLTVGGISLPDDWSTKGWTDKNGKPGYFPNAPFVAGGALGGATAADPLVYRIGVDFHLRFEFQLDEKPYHSGDSNQHRAPKGMQVGVLPEETNEAHRTDAAGEYHGLVFNIKGGDEVSFMVDFNIEDPSINLPNGKVPMNVDNVNTWYTSSDDADRKYFPGNTLTSLGTQTSPVVISCSLDRRNVAMFFLTMLYEHASFFYHITDGAWKGVDGMEIRFGGLGSGAYSWPVGTLHITSDWWPHRPTLIHELSHQVMWKEVGISSLNIVGQVVSPDGLCMSHSEDLLANPTHAVIEGWAEIYEGTFEPGEMVLKPTDKVHEDGGDPVPLGPNPVNQGESVEGAFAKAMIGIFGSFVVGSASSTANVPRSFNGDVTIKAPWVKNAGVKQRFKSAIWDPLHALDSSTPTTTDFLASMKKGNPSAWPDMSLKLNAYNLAREQVQVLSVSPASGPAAGGQMITIKGVNFNPGHNEVHIGSKAVTLFHSVADDQGEDGVNTTTITCTTPPNTPGKFTIVVVTPAGSGMLSQGYEYISPLPTVTSVSPARGVIAGGDTITISGTNFDPGQTQVSIGGNAVAYFLSAMGKDPTITLLCNTPAGSAGKADIIVTTAAGSATLPAAFEYVYPTSSPDP